MSRTRELSQASDAIAPPRFAAAWAALIYALCTLALAYPALSGQFLVNPHSDQYIAGYAFRDFAAGMLRAGQGFPLWNPYQFGGMPYVAAMHGDIFYPTFLLRMLLPTDVAMTWEFPIHLFLAGLFTYGFLRAWGIGFFGALVGGLAYMLSGQIASLVSPGHDGKLFVNALLPLALWFVTRGVRDGRTSAWGGLAVTVGLAVLSPHPQLLQYLLLASGVFALYAAFAEYDGQKLGRPIAFRRLTFALGSVVLGAAIGAIQYLPVMEYVPFSPRAGGTGYDFATQYSMPWEELLVNTYLPQFTGILDKYWGRNGIHFHSEYLGVVPLFLAGAAFGADWRKGFRRLWLGVIIGAAIWALGGNTPLFHVLYAIPPLGAKYFRAPSTIFFLVSFGVAVLAGMGMDRLLAGAVGRRYAIGWLVAGALLALVASGPLNNLTSSLARTIGAQMAETRGIPQAADQFGAQLSDIALNNSRDLLVGGWRSFFFIAIAAIGVLAFWRKALTARALAWALVGATAADLWSIDRLYWLFSPPAHVLYASDPVIDYLERQQQPGRVLVSKRGDEGLAHPDPYFGSNGSGSGAGLMIHGVRTVTGYQGNAISRYEQLAGLSGSERPTLGTPEFWRLENTRYLYTNTPVADSNFKLLVGPEKNSAGSTIYLYGLPGTNPFAWVAPAMVKAPDDQALATVLDQRFDPTRAAIVDSAAPVKTVQLASLPEPSRNPVAVEHYEPGKVDLALERPAAEGDALIASENYYPGWRAVADGKPATVARMDYNLVGIALPAGAKRVQLRFDDPAYETGKMVTLIALGLALALWIGGAVVDQRRTSTAT
jgi:hypothetical protein